MMDDGIIAAPVCRAVPVDDLKKMYGLLQQAMSPKITFKENMDEMRKEAERDVAVALQHLELELRPYVEPYQ